MKIGTSSLLRFLLAGILALGTFSFAWAQFSGGSGTPASPFQVANVNQLNSIRNHLSAHFIQIADIDLDIAPYNQGTGWQPIGSVGNPFTGSFDGAGFSIGSLYINNPVADYQALFGNTQSANLQGITLDAVMVNGKDYCAALVASAENSQITECHVSGSINGAANSGGLVGSLEMTSSISNSSAEINLNGTNAIGGLCGYIKGSSLVSGSVARGSVSGGTAVGGLVGILADSEISDCYSRAAVSGTRYIGGLLGINDLDGLVNRCYSTGLVSGNQNTGGLIGRSILAHTTDSYWDTQTSGQASSAGGDARNTEQMLPPYEGNTYAAWDFASIWNAHPTYNDGYPYLEWEYTVPTAVALLVYNKNNLNAYDTGFINVLNTITTDYEMIDIAEISSGQKNLSTYRVVISNFMGFGTTAATAFNSIAAQLEAATQAGTEFIVGSESVSIPVVLGLANGAMNGYFVPALNNTRAISELAINDAITAGVNPIPDYQSYLGQDGLMLSNYFGEGVFWKVMSGGIGDYYRLTTFIQNPVFRLNTIYSGFDVSDYQYPDGPMEFRKNNSRILNLKRFWTQNNDTRAKGWIGPEGIQILSNAISHYLTTDYVETPPSELGGVFYTMDGSQRTIHWNAVVDADYYEIWYSTDGSTWNPIGLQSEDGSGSYAWLSPITTTNLYRVRPILGDTPGAFVDALPALPEIIVMPSSVNLSLPAESLISETFEIINIGLGDLEFNSQILEGFRDLSITFSPAQGVLAAGDTLLCELHVDSAATEPGLYEFTLQITSNDPDTPVINIPVTIEVTSPLAYIPDDNFRMAINNTLGQGPDYQPTIQDMESLNGYLFAGSRGVTSIEGAQHLSNLSELVLHNNQISDLSPLTNLSNLQILDIHSNQISDLTPLADLGDLQWLFLHRNQINDLTPLADLGNMQELDLGYNQISNISPLAGLSNLYELYLNNNQISDLSPLANLSNLGTLWLQNNQISDINSLASLSNIQWLYLHYNQISDLSPLANLSNLQGLNLPYNPISYESMLLSQSWSLPYTTSTYEPLSPCYPDPLRAAMVVAPDAGLSWQANYNSSSTALYEVHLGTSSDALTYIGEGTWVNGTTYSFATDLEPFTEYWWKVKAVEDSTEIWSGMWSFTTGEVIQNPQIQLTPSAFYETLDVGESSVQYLSIENTGDANLEYSIGIDYRYRTEETLYPNLASGSISNMQRNGGVDPNPRLGKKITQYPDREGETFNVLVMEEIADHAYYSLALNNLGIPHTFVNNWSLLQQELDSTQSWDLIVVNSYSSPPTQQLLDDLAAYITAGGQLIFADWAIGEFYTHALLQDLGIGFISSYTQPKPFTATLASHPIFNTPNQIQELLVTNDQANIDGQVVSVLPGATALAEFSVDPYSSAIVLGANGSSIFNAFQADNFKGDHDEDGKLDILELLENQIVYLLGDYQQAWLSVSPTIGTVEPGTSEMIEIAFDASNISAGVHNSNLIVSSNDPSSAQIIVPVELEVMNIAEAMIEVYPEFIEHSLLQDSTDQVELEITNSGNAALNWTATVEEVRREASAPVATHPRVTAELRPERDSRPGMERIELPKPEMTKRESSLLRARNVLLDLDPDNGLVEAESSVFCWLNIDSSGSLSGTYEYQIVISSNAVNEPELIIPVSITVEGTPAYIPDDHFRMAINDALGQGAEYQPSIQDMESLIGYLDAEGYGISSIEGAQYLSNLDELNLADNQFGNLSPLANLSNLETLWLDNNNISDLNPLANMSNLTELDVGHNHISDLSPLANLSNLVVLLLDFNHISDIRPLANMSNLGTLWLQYNQISDLSPLSNLSNLQWLRLEGNQISDLSPIADLSIQYELHLDDNPLSYESMLLSQSWSLPWSTDTYDPLSPCYPDPQRVAMDVDPEVGLSWQGNYDSSPLVLYEVYLGTNADSLSFIGEGTWVEGTTYQLTTYLEPFTHYFWRVKVIDADTEIWSGLWSFTTGETFEVIIPDDNFRMAINEALGQDVDYQPTVPDLESLTGTLSADAREIFNIEGAQYLTNLEVLFLDGNQIQDISPLSSLSNLNQLYLGNNQISDLTPLSSLTNLQHLYLYNNQISDITPLNTMTGLLELYLNHNQISMIMALENLTNLQWLYLNNNQISDISFLSNLTELYYLDLSENQIIDIYALAYLTQLQSLLLNGNQIFDISPLFDLTSLSELELAANSLSNITNLAGLSNLQTLYLDINQINDISALQNLENLQALGISFNDISDLSPIANLSGLNYLFISSNPLSYESMLLTQSWALPATASTFEPLAPCYPDPERETMDADPETGFSWQGNYDSSPTATYEVYLYGSTELPSLIGEGTWVEGTTYTLNTTLEPNTEYWWRVKAIDGASEIWSGMWSFTTGDYSEFAGGDGSESDPYQVATAEHLNNVRNYPDAHFIQAADIDLGVSPWNDGDGWQPIGSEAERFSGVYFGNDYSINQMSISRPSESNLGLFGVLDGAMIHNLHVSASDVTGINWCGIISGRAYNSDFFNCHAEGSVTGTGGSIGGLMGRMDNSSLYYSSFGGTVSSSGAPVGGLIGRLDASEIGACWAIADVSGGSIVGGLAGYTLANSTIYESYSSGSASSSGDYVGGITGSAAYTISITSCYSHSAVSGNSYVGGLIGETDGATLSGCYSTGTVEGNSNTGGLVGFNTAASSAEDCYWDTDSSLLSTSVLGYGRTTAEMTYPYAMNTYNNWDFNEIWAADLDHETNSGYPYFRWYATAPDYHPPRFVQAGLDIPGARVMWYSPLVGLPSSYQVHRLIPGQESDEALWTLVADAVADTIFFDTDWESLPEGTYKWAVKARYTDQLSIAELSDELYKEVFFEPIISVNPTSVSEVMESNSVAEVPITIGNMGSGNLDWNTTLSSRQRNSTGQTHLSKTSGSSRVYSILFSPETGSIPPGSEEICILSIDTSGATAGTELFELTIYSNDPVTPVYVIPISIEVLPPAINNAPIVSNVRATQRDDVSMMIDIYYDVYDADGDALIISMEVSADDGVTWDLSCTQTLTGSDIGTGILSGTDKHIVWDAAIEHPNLLYGENFRFRITADDGVADMPDNFVFVEGGTFNNGTSDVTLSSFYIDKYELTQAGYQAVMGVNPSYFPGNPNRPVEQVSWFNAIEYCNRRSMQEGLTPCYSYSTYGSNPDDWPTGWNTSDANHTNVSCNWSANGYRLPTEMEWMFAAKGGNQSQGYTYSGSNTIGNVAWYRDNSDIGDGQGTRTHDVGLKDPNELGTFDMSGNVLEWVWDIWGTYPSGNQTNPTGADSGSHRVLRGGSWYSVANGCTVSFWFYVDATYTVYSIGFRVLRVSP